jgi:hypothetical protein
MHKVGQSLLLRDAPDTTGYRLSSCSSNGCLCCLQATNEWKSLFLTWSCYLSWVLANILTESFHWFWKLDKHSGHRLYNSSLKFWADYCLLIYTHPWELMKSLGSQGRVSWLFMLKVMVWHFVSDTHKVMTAFIFVMLAGMYQMVTFKVLL